MKTKQILIATLAGLSLTLAALAQADEKPTKPAEKLQQAPQGPPKFPVGFIAVQPKAMSLTKNLPGRLVAMKNAAVRARVTGIVEKRFFEEGSYVKAGDKLFQIDDRQLQANLSSAQAQLAQAQASQNLSAGDVKRYKKLLRSKAISRQVYDQANAQLLAANAAIQAAEAAITQAKLNIEYANVVAPIDGFIGQTAVTEGDLVSAATSTVMAEIQQINPLYIDIKQPAAQIINYKKMAMKNGQQGSSKPNKMVKVFLSDGTPYEHSGQLLFANMMVDASTGESSLRAKLPNPDKLLMPGLYVRVEVPLTTVDNAVLLPQQAVNRGKMDTVFVITGKDGYAPRPVKVAQSQNNQWLITSGLKAGDKVIVDGMQKVLMMRLKTVTPVPYGMKPPKLGQKPMQKTMQKSEPAQQSKQQ